MQGRLLSTPQSFPFLMVCLWCGVSWVSAARPDGLPSVIGCFSGMASPPKTWNTKGRNGT